MRSFNQEKGNARKMNERGRITGLRKNGEEFPAVASILSTAKGKGTNFTVILRDMTAIARMH